MSALRDVRDLEVSTKIEDAIYEIYVIYYILYMMCYSTNSCEMMMRGFIVWQVPRKQLILYVYVCIYIY